MNGFLKALLLVAASQALVAQDRREEGNLVYENVPAISDALKAEVRTWTNVRAARMVDWHPDGGMVVSTRFGQVSQLHHVAIPGGARTQLTFFGEPVSGASWAPDGGTFKGYVYSRDIGGSENYQIFLKNEASGETTMITDGKSRNGGASWDWSGERIAYVSNARNGTFWDLYIHDVKSGTSKMVFQAPAWAYRGIQGFSRDGKKLLVSVTMKSGDSWAEVHDLASGDVQDIRPATQSDYYVAWGEDDQTLYATSNMGGEFRQLYRYDLAKGAHTLLTGDIPWDIGGFDMADDGKHYLFTVNEDGLSKLHIRKTADDSVVAGPTLPVGQVSGARFTSDSKTIGFSMGTAFSPTDAFSWKLGGGDITRWTTSEMGDVDRSVLVDQSLVHFKSFDGTTVPAFVMKPKKAGKHPVIIRIHGGPASQARPGYSSTYQYWVKEHGVAVIQPNVRGSTGYGRTYMDMDNGFKREDSVRDIGALLDWIRTQPDLDADRVIVYGGSYGGYMVLASLMHYSDRLLGAIDVVGISNFVTFLENTKSYRRDHRRGEYGDERDSDMRGFLTETAPVLNVHKMTKPLFIIQGLNDPRVPASEAEQMLEAYRTRGIPVWYLAAKDEGHGFRKLQNREVQAAAMSLFIKGLLEGSL